MRITEQFRRYISDRRGGAALTLALLTPFIIGGLAFGAELGLWEQSRRKLQDAVDLAAHAAGTQLRSGIKNQDSLKAIARPIAELGGYRGDASGVHLSTPPDAGAYAGDPSAVRVVLDNSLPRYFTSIFNKTPVSFTVAATALVSSGRPACILALHSTASGAIATGGSASVKLTACDLAANSVSDSAVLTTGGAVEVETGCVTAVGGVVDPHNAITYTDCPGPIVNAPITADPYADVPEPAVSGCQNANAFTNAGNPSRPAPGCYNNVGAISRDIELAPGLYILNNSDLRLNGSRKITGTGVTLFMAGNSSIKVNGNATINITAPTKDDATPCTTYCGVAIFGDRDSAGEFDLTGNSGVSIVGAIYSPNSDITFTGNNAPFTAGQCTQVIGGTVTFWGNSDFDTDCSASGTREITTGQTVRVVE
ncbi:MAG: TadE/TadG family type IV pilus assembly protein [Pseudomonadota bacterium]|nr:TadE/TadG family type IV pilus assembly protein [Pseudomonadota bacterium]